MDVARSATVAGTKPASNYRWVVCLLLFVITTINYIDRNILGVLKPTIQGDLHFNRGPISATSSSSSRSPMRWGTSAWAG